MKMLFAIAGFALSVVLIAEAGVALPRASSVERSPAVERVGFGCNFINGKLVCGKSESGDDVDDEDNQKHMQDDEDDNHKHKKNAKDTDSELTECTIQKGPGGGGCVKGFKHVCEKLKSGKKCCGCVPDKNAQAPAGGAMRRRRRQRPKCGPSWKSCSPARPPPPAPPSAAHQMAQWLRSIAIERQVIALRRGDMRNSLDGYAAPSAEGRLSIKPWRLADVLGKPQGRRG